MSLPLPETPHEVSQMIEVPDIGDFDSVPIIELFVKVGDSIKVDDAICTLESDKATMDVPSSAAGVVRKCWSIWATRSAKARC
jgi:pyruvate/2-oxoglutarate dehydrogenase complex dihydrolipoamide acyltransferase (E2) component